jgi:HEAT repeat protein
MGLKAAPYLAEMMTKRAMVDAGTPDLNYYEPLLQAFEVLGPDAQPAAPYLIKSLGRNFNCSERALISIGKGAVPLLADKLVETLSDTNNPYYFTGIRMAVRTTNGCFIRDRILIVLNQLGTNAEAALPALIQTVATNRHQLYYLREGNWMGGGFYQDPYNVLARVGQNHPEIVVPILLNEFSNSALPQVEAQRFARDIATQKRRQIIAAMSVLGTNQAGAFVPVLINALSDKTTNDWSRIQMGETLTDICGNQPNVLIPVFLAALTNNANDEGIKCGLAGSLVKIARNQPDIVVPALITVYTNSGIEGRSSVAGMLAEFGDKSRSMVPLLILDSHNKDLPINRPSWKIALAVAAKKIAPENTNALSALIYDLEKSDGGTQQQRFRAFGELGTNGMDAVPVMLKFLTNDVTQLRCDAIEALNAIGVKSDEYIYNLAQTIHDTNYFVADYSQSALCSLATNSQLAFNTVLKKVINGSAGRDARQQAKYRLIDISRENPQFLLEALDDPDPLVRSGDLYVFYDLARSVSDSIPKLRELAANDPDSNVRSQAADVLKLQSQ